jgi:hypothetical protein
MKPLALPSPSSPEDLPDLDRAVLHAADGARTVPEIAAHAARALGRPVAPWQVFAALDALSARGLVAAPAAGLTPTGTGALRALGVAAALLAIGVVPAHGSDGDDAPETSDDGSDTDAKADKKADKKSKSDDDAEKKKLTAREIQQKSRQEASEKRALKRKTDPRIQEERLKKRLGPLR